MAAAMRLTMSVLAVGAAIFLGSTIPWCAERGGRLPRRGRKAISRRSFAKGRVRQGWRAGGADTDEDFVRSDVDPYCCHWRRHHEGYRSVGSPRDLGG